MEGPQTIVIVDDHQDSLDLCRTLLEMEGYAVHAFSDPAEALAALRAMDPPSLILLDMLMPTIDGIAFLESLEASRTLSATPVLVLSAAPSEAQRSTRRFLLKPVAPAALISVIKEVCAPG